MSRNAVQLTAIGAPATNVVLGNCSWTKRKLSQTPMPPAESPAKITSVALLIPCFAFKSCSTASKIWRPAKRYPQVDSLGLATVPLWRSCEQSVPQTESIVRCNCRSKQTTYTAAAHGSSPRSPDLQLRLPNCRIRGRALQESICWRTGARQGESRTAASLYIHLRTTAQCP